MLAFSNSEENSSSFSEKANGCYGDLEHDGGCYVDVENEECSCYIDESQQCTCCHGYMPASNEFVHHSNQGHDFQSGISNIQANCKGDHAFQVGCHGNSNHVSLATGDAKPPNEYIHEADIVMASNISIMDVAMAEDMMRFLRLHPPCHRTVAALQEEENKLQINRLSCTSFDSHYSFGVDGISLSDSCCESFSSTDNENDTD